MTPATADLFAQHSRAPGKPVRPPRRWPVADVQALFDLPFLDLLFLAQQVHHEHFDANEVQLSTLFSIKAGGCPEDCAYCPQSAHFDTGADSIFYGDRLLTTANPQAARDRSLFERLGLRAMEA